MKKLMIPFLSAFIVVVPLNAFAQTTIGDFLEGWRGREASGFFHRIVAAKTSVEDWYTMVWTADGTFVLAEEETQKYSFLFVWVGKYDAYTGNPLEFLNLAAELPNKLNSERDSLRVEEFANGAMLILRNVKACDPWEPKLCRSVDGQIPWYPQYTLSAKGGFNLVSWTMYYSVGDVYPTRDTKFTLKIAGKQMVEGGEVLNAYVREDTYDVIQ